MKSMKAPAKKMTPAQAKLLATHLGGKPMTRKSKFPAPKKPMDAEDVIDGGADEATEKS